MSCYPLTIADQPTRFLLTGHGLHSTEPVTARPIVERAFREYGLPVAIRTDNGVPFATQATHGLLYLNGDGGEHPRETLQRGGRLGAGGGARGLVGAVGHALRRAVIRQPLQRDDCDAQAGGVYRSLAVHRIVVDPAHAAGTALSLQVSLGFLLTMVSIQLVQPVAQEIGWRWAFPMLALGPAAGIAAIRRLSGRAT